MFIEKTAQVDIGKEGVTITLAVPYTYGDRNETVYIPYMTSHHYRTRKYEDGTKEAEMDMLMKLTDMSEREIDALDIADLAVCLGVIRGFFLQFQTTSEIYYAQSTKLILERLQQNLTG